MAVIGMSCRFAPDLDSLDKFWAFISAGSTAISDMPDKRWDPYGATSPQATAILRKTTRKGSYLTDIEGFDADFFGISPREADYLDPQQRIVLELAWEALENAGVPPLSLRGTDAGVFVAANSNDYGRRLLEDITRTGAWAVNGTTYYGIANRISYFLDLRGPSIAVDTACAGSLTALHVACQSLRTGESPVAIVGGINIIATPALNVALDAAGATTADGWSKAFDAAADGYGRGEGAGVVVLKRLADAQRDGDPVLAVIRGSGVFQDGRSEGMMAPNGSAQEHMLRRAYERAGISPAEVDYVEAHGTGTPVGDREEAQALSAVFGADRPADKPCLIGSVKPNIGHTEAGSGIAGVIKTVLALRHEEVPPSLHEQPNPQFDWASSGLKLVDGRTPWKANGRPRIAGVSSYGVGGSIAHVILQDAAAVAGTQDTVAAGAANAPLVYPVSAMSENGLKAVAAETADWLTDNAGASLAGVGQTLSRRRSHLSQRAAVVASTTGELAAKLRVVAEGGRGAGIAKGRAAAGQATGPVWVFSGHGSQWAGMGRQLLIEEPVFAQAIDSLAQVFDEELGWTPREALESGGPWSSYQVQALTFAMQIGLAHVWHRYGVKPGAIIGHSVGEIAAAAVAGALDVAEAARFACKRAKALQQLQGAGGMVLVGLPFEQVEQQLAGRTDLVAGIAASPTSTVVSGDREVVEQAGAQWAAEGLTVYTVDTDIAFHSPHTDAVVAEVAAAAAQLNPRPARVPLYSTALTDPRSADLRDSSYWTTNLRQPVRFAAATAAAIEDGHRLFLEISSHPVVTHSIKESLSAVDVEDATVVPSLRRDSDEVGILLGSLAELHANGAAVDWTALHPGEDLVTLPTMAWQHRPYWIFPAEGESGSTGGGHNPDDHTLLGGQMSVSGAPARQVWQTYLDMDCRPYPQDHEVVDVEITPAAVIINSFTAAAQQDGRLPGLSDMVLRTPLAVMPSRTVQIVLSESTLRLSTRIADAAVADDDHEWITHSTANVDWSLSVPDATVDAAALRARTSDEWTWRRVDDMFRRMGVGGYAFHWDVEEIRRNDVEQMAIIDIAPPPAKYAHSWAQVIDGALTISAVLVTPEYAKHQWMSSHIDSVAYTGLPPARITVHSRRNAKSPSDTVDVLVADETGKVVAEVVGLRFSAIQDEAGSVAPPRELAHEMVWRELDLSIGTETRLAKAVLVGDGATASWVASQLQQAGVEVARVFSPEDLEPVTLSQYGAVLVAPAALVDGEGPEAAAERCAWTLIRTMQRLIDAQTANELNPVPLPRLWAVTDGVRAAGEVEALAHGPIWGVGRIIAGEHPELWGGTLDLAGRDAVTAAWLLPAIQRLAGQEDVISVTSTGVAGARLNSFERPADGTALQCRATDTYLITGGLGALGLLVARWLADRGARRLLLAGRKGLPARAEWAGITDPRTRRQIDSVLELEALGVTVKILSLDITNEAEVAAAVDPSTHGLPPVRGIVHAAGVVRDAMVDKMDLEGLQDAMAPKVLGAMALHRIFPPGSLDFFVLFSSCGQFARLTGQASYAAANSFLDTLAAHRTATGHRETTSIGWTSWRGVGMSESIGTTMMEANSRGLEAVSAAEAFRAWAFADRFHAPYQAILRVLPTPPNQPRLPMLRELTATSDSAGDGDSQGFSLDWSLSDDELRAQATADVREQVAIELNLGAEDVDARRPLVELGFDSVMTVALRVRLTRRYGLDLPPNILWSKPTVTALALHILEGLRAQELAAV
ncbi:beta-ketoacyl synthase N-terminal-like domain-containing protein [Catellatospora sp. KI3]|uniref:type I polyketide synthase n=1 Tax=Catellatospora sp. KI3 TaxID=3041620 RepID=UPI002482F930|nr:type I polyketide synthase [Catellatospora sp. KI3]MDI1461436.1 beta-ketoacyl synthase N-terminal-like domain-containing protein [Catellatospora sp. KI3]